MAKPFDYSKWDNIELSDDESDLHPNIDKESWFRLKHRTRVEREEREDQECREIAAKNTEDEARIQLIKAQLQGVSSGESADAEFVDTEALEEELNELQRAVAGRKARMEDIQDRRKWNIDNICKVKEDKTIVNKISSAPLRADIAELDTASSPTAAALAEKEAATASATAAVAAASSAPAVVAAKAPAATATAPAKPAVGPKPAGAGPEPPAPVKRERMAVISYNDYCLKHESILEKYSEIADLETTKEFLFKHCDILLHEHAQSYILLSCLEDEMNGKHKRMKLVCRQSQILSHIHELGMSMKRDPRDVILPFFKRIEEKEYLQGFLAAVDDFIGKIRKRAVEKRKEMDEERRRSKADQGEEEEEEEELVYEVEGQTPLGPGGLDPIQVLKSLPKPLRKAFESQDVGQLQKVLSEMNPSEARMWMKKCVDSGLWVSKDPTAFNDDADDEAHEDDDDVEGEAHEGQGDVEGEGEREAQESEELDK